MPVIVFLCICACTHTYVSINEYALIFMNVQVKAYMCRSMYFFACAVFDKRRHSQMFTRCAIYITHPCKVQKCTHIIMMHEWKCITWRTWSICIYAFVYMHAPQAKKTCTIRTKKIRTICIQNAPAQSCANRAHRASRTNICLLVHLKNTTDWYARSARPKPYIRIWILGPMIWWLPQIDVGFGNKFCGHVCSVKEVKFMPANFVVATNRTSNCRCLLEGSSQPFLLCRGCQRLCVLIWGPFRLTLWKYGTRGPHWRRRARDQVMKWRMREILLLIGCTREMNDTEIRNGKRKIKKCAFNLSLLCTFAKNNWNTFRLFKACFA